ncbi:acylglycerol kinase family protein [Gammaproteobacteria bacterium]|nr:acylglycerol kinase family protein [Gammaproteobacteria bacterium]
MRHLILWNPLSGRGRSAAIVRACEKYLTSHSLPFRCVSVLHAEQFNSKDWDLIVVIGGDGTLHHLAQNQPILFDLPILMIAAGTGNLIAKSLGLPRAPKAALALCTTEKKIVTWPSVDINSPQLDFHLKAVALMSLGLDAAVMGELARHRAGPIRLIDFIKPILTTCMGYQFHQFAINQVISNALIYSVLPCYARSWMKLTSEPINQWASYRYQMHRLFSWIQSYFFMTFKTLAAWSKFEVDHDQSLTLNADHDIDLQVDGEYIGSFRQLSITQSKQCLSFISGNNDESSFK